MRPLLLPGTYFVPVSDGVYARGPSGAFLLPGGPALHAWLERIAPRLTGEHTVAELCAELPAEKAATVEAIVGQLVTVGLVRDGCPAPEPKVAGVGSGALFDAWRRCVRTVDLADADVVVHIGDQPSEHEHPLLWQAIHAGDAVWVVPPAVSWSPPDDEPRPMSEPATTVIAHQLVLLCRRAPVEHVVRVDLKTLRTTEHDPNAIELGEHGFAQMPLRVTRAVVGEREVFASGFDFAEVRRAAGEGRSAGEDADAERYLRILRIARVGVSIHQVADGFVFVVGQRTVAHTSTKAAGLRQVVLDYQARSTGQLAYVPAVPA